MRTAGIRLGVLGVLGTIACQKPAVDEPPRTCARCRWELLGVHAQSAAQPTATGQALITLCPWRGRLYVGYGDYQQNTGPIDVTAWDPATRGFVRYHTSDTEAINSYRVIGDQLYAPATDRRERADYAVGEPWHDEHPVAVAHAYDMATFDGHDLWLVGSSEAGYRPTAWRSTDGGASWTIAHELPSNGRYYFAARYHDKIYLEAWSLGPHGPSEVFDGARWTTGPELLPAGGHGFRPVDFAGRLVYATKQTFDIPHIALANTANLLIAFDGVTARVTFERPLLDFFASAEALFVLDTEGVIWRTTDLAQWSQLVDASALRPRSLALLEQALYVGSRDSRLYRLVGWP